MGSRDSDSHHDELIERLQAEAAAAIDGPMVVYESDALTPQVQEQFWREVVAFENAGTTDLIKELTAIGVALPEPHGLDDAAIHDALWKVIEALTKLSVFLHFTDHLSDRELYIHLLREILPEEMASLDTEENSAWHIDV